MTLNRYKFIFVSLAGNILEWYDFAIYGYFASVLAKLFFPGKNILISLTLIFSIYATGFIMRPLGGIIFGHIGDKYGRRKALVLSIILMLIPTFGIGILPGYASMGVVAPFLLTLLRVLQGLAVSGELIGSGTFLIESAPKGKTGFYGSLGMASTYLGLMLGALASVLISIFFDNVQIENYAWRIPFLLSLILGLGALYLRMNCEESPAYMEIVKKNRILQYPVKVALKKYKWEILNIFFISSCLAVAIYLLIAYFPSYFVTQLKMSLTQSLEVSLIGLVVLTLCVPIMGYISDLVGHEKLLFLGAISFLAFSLVIFNFAMQGSFTGAVISVILTSFFLSPIAATLILVISKNFPSNVRYSSVSLGYNMSMTIFGGTTPLIAVSMSRFFNTGLAPAYYLLFCSLLTLVSLRWIRHYNFKLELLNS